VSVVLADHSFSDEINEGLAAERGFQETFPGEVNGDLEDLRLLFDRKAFIARQEKVCGKLLEDGHTSSSLAAMVVSDLPRSPEVDAYMRRRGQLGLDTSPHAPLVVTAGGDPVPEKQLRDHLRFARAVRVSIEANGGMCRSLLATRYGLPDPEEATV
jgi:hypothetical protein